MRTAAGSRRADGAHRDDSRSGAGPGPPGPPAGTANLGDMTAFRPAASAAGAEVVTATLDLTGSLFGALPDPVGTSAFVTDGDGLVGWGQYARFSVTGADAAARIADWFRAELDELGPAGSAGAAGPKGEAGPVVFVSLGFDVRDASVAVIPQVVLRRRDGHTVSTVIGPSQHRSVTPVTGPGTIRYSDASMSVAGFTSAVAQATARIRSGELGKVVLAHDLTAMAENPVDERFLLAALADRYPTCWTYAVDGLLGASPEMLMHRNGSRVHSRVLAGTGWSEHTGDRVSEQLESSLKDQREHRYAADSVAAGLGPVCRTLEVPARPTPLVLANLTHLATDIVGELVDPAPSALELAALLHPTAAVGGFPTDAALQAIRELEPGPRGRYAGPIGWMDGTGDGEFALALRGALVSGRSVRMTAGCGIVADSDPRTEAREAQVKMIPIRDALES